MQIIKTFVRFLSYPETEISIDQTQFDNSSSDEPCQQKINPLYATLAKQCVLTPFTHLNTGTHIQTLTEYIKINDTTMMR